jgi:hypothetical protein
MSRMTTIGLLSALALGIAFSSAHADGRSQLAQAPAMTTMCNEAHLLPDLGQCVGPNCLYLGPDDRVSGPTFPWGCRQPA